jgi:hypothetical protein
MIGESIRTPYFKKNEMKNIAILLLTVLIYHGCTKECDLEEHLGEYKFVTYNDCPNKVLNKNNIVITKKIDLLIELTQASSSPLKGNLSRNEIQGSCYYSLTGLPDLYVGSLTIKGKTAEIIIETDIKTCETLVLEKVK